MDKVQGGTLRGGSESMCSSCRAAQVIKGTNNQEFVICRASGYPNKIAFPVVSCSSYDDKAMPALYQMESIAWTIHSRNRGPMGYAGGSSTEIHIDPPSQFPGQQNQPAVGKTKENL